jgi:hypothetical protein
MRCGFSESEHKGSVAHYEQPETIARHQANMALFAEEIFSNMLASQEAKVNAAWAEARAEWFSSTHKLLNTPPARRVEALKWMQIMHPFKTSSGPVSQETAMKVQELLAHFESTNNFGIKVKVSVYMDTVLENVFEVTMTEPSVTSDQLTKAFE